MSDESIDTEAEQSKFEYCRKCGKTVSLVHDIVSNQNVWRCRICSYIVQRGSTITVKMSGLYSCELRKKSPGAGINAPAVKTTGIRKINHIDSL